MRQTKQEWLLNCSEVLVSAMRRVIMLENGCITLDYMMFDDEDYDLQEQRDYIDNLNKAEQYLNKAADALDEICKLHRVIPERRCPR